MKKRTKKQEKEFQEQLIKDHRNLQIHIRSKMVRESIFLLFKAEHRLQDSEKYYDCSQHPDFDDLNHNVYDAHQFIEFAIEKLEEISERDWEFGVTPEQIGAKLKKS